jgi:uncharacterized protein (DUF983 family)
MSMTTTTEIKRDYFQAMKRGAMQRCPACGVGNLFRKYLKVVDECPACHEELHHHRADDFPAYLVIFIVGHIVVSLVLAVEMAYQPSYWIHGLLWVPLTLMLALALLPPVKGAVVGLQWALRMHGFDGNGGDDLSPVPAPSPKLTK